MSGHPILGTAGEFHNNVVARAFEGKTVPCLEHEDVTALNTVLSSIQLSTSLVSVLFIYLRKKIVYQLFFLCNRSLNLRSSLTDLHRMAVSLLSASRNLLQILAATKCIGGSRQSAK